MFKTKFALFFALVLSPTQLLHAECLEKGGRQIKGKCYCYRTWDDTTLSEGRECPALWGLELTFTNPALCEATKNTGNPFSGLNTFSEATQQAWIQKIYKVCKERKQDPVHPDQCHVQENRVTYKDGFYYEVSLDPAVIELQTRPMSKAELEISQNRIKTDIFDLAEGLGLSPHSEIGAGHLHLDIASHFKGNLRLLADFIVDFQNHPTFSMGPLAENYLNAPPLAIQSKKQRQALTKLTRKIHQFRNVDQLTDFIQDSIFYRTLLGEPAQKFQAISTHHAEDLGTLEIRSLRPQANWEQIFLLVDLFEAKLKQLKSNESPVIYQGKWFSFPIADENMMISQHRSIPIFYQRPFFIQLSLDEYYDYVTSAGLSWEIYRDLLPLKFRKSIPSPLKTVNHPTDQSTLAVAASMGDLEKVRELISQGHDPIKPDETGWSALELAIIDSQLPVLEFLLQHLSDLPLKERQSLIHEIHGTGFNLVELAILSHSPKQLDLLQDFGRKFIPNNPNTHLTPLIFAAQMGRPDMIDRLLDGNKPKNLAGLHDQENNLALAVASKYGHLEVVEQLLKKGTDPNTSVEGTYPLSVASKNGFANIVRALGEAGADTNVRDIKEMTPLTYAATAGHVDIVELLVQFGAKKSHRGKKRRTPLHLAALNGHLEIVKYLLKKGVRRNLADEAGSTPLHLASENGHLQAVEALVFSGAHLEIEDENHFTPLASAVAVGEIEIVRFLLNQDAEITPMVWTTSEAPLISKNHERIRRLLAISTTRHVVNLITGGRRYSGIED
jgi:ankyrin repeat protein